MPCICAHAHFHTFMDLCGHVRYSHQRQARKEALTRYKIIRHNSDTYKYTHKIAQVSYASRVHHTPPKAQTRQRDKTSFCTNCPWGCLGPQNSWEGNWIGNKAMTSVESRSPAFSVETTSAIFLFVIHSSNLEYSIWQFLTIYTPEV